MGRYTIFFTVSFIKSSTLGEWQAVKLRLSNHLLLVSSFIHLKKKNKIVAILHINNTILIYRKYSNL